MGTWRNTRQFNIHRGKCRALHIGGYIVKNLRKKLTRLDDADALDALSALCNTDENMEPAESEEWISSVDRGGLVRLTEDAYKVFCAIEYSIRQHFRISNAANLDSETRER